MTQDIKNIAIAIFFVVATIVLVIAGHSIRSTNAEIHGLVQDIRKDEKDIRPTLQNVNAILIQVGLAADELQDASRKQNAYWDANSQADKRDDNKGRYAYRPRPITTR
jgi:uncharacterized protein YoxC